jgi:hypothetical protein
MMGESRVTLEVGFAHDVEQGMKESSGTREAFQQYRRRNRRHFEKVPCLTVVALESVHNRFNLHAIPALKPAPNGQSDSQGCGVSHGFRTGTCA